MFEKALGALRDGVMILDRSQKLIYANPALGRIAGEDLLQIEGRQLLEVIRAPELADLVVEVKKDGQEKEIEFLLLFPQKMTLSASAYLIPEGTVLILRDITEMKRLEGLRQEFVANVSHELKTPLTAIRNYVDTLLDGAVEDPAYNRDFLKKIEKNTDSLSNLINDILAISKIESRKEFGAPAPIDLSRVVSRAIDDLLGKAQTKKVEIELLCDESSFITKAIEDQVYRAVINLLDNAINYSSEGGKIRASCRQQEGALEIVIEDNGIGIPKEHLERIFERFYRVDRGRSREMGGTGLGLAIVKHIMGLHGGSVRVESDEGKGSKFYLSFPAA